MGAFHRGSPTRDLNTLDLKLVSNTAFSAIQSYIESRTDLPESLTVARDDAAEYSLSIPDDSTGRLLTTLTAASAHPDSAGAVAITPAAAVVGLYILAGLEGKTTVTCIDPEADYQNRAKATFREAGYPSSRARFLPSRPSDVISRLAAGSYQLVYVDAPSVELPTLVPEAYTLLTPGGTLVIPDALLDGTLADETRRDRDTEAAREVDQLVEAFDQAIVTRLPLGAGLTLVTRKA
ncbi:Putative O-methyltransferase [Corynebacterium cystitidis DSM 20524]|uniref:Predicted O-methyltransferase YrrM n=1 Tax=Corynebacterium cystitidis DSM 20524 TaxID=1121357 RepID=A0A1H9RWD3_9CORY|nr:Putative O-methyltransferase [Corynebacterium cystitidis DSM 20524]SER76977.1 Predicted O-methyltransferase YrrM [Corynebacterium cystitidis DSM 20524]SNV79241.1 methyltransferase [Corynebacterium cystitidis]